jgi:hypothetical protein
VGGVSKTDEAGSRDRALVNPAAVAGYPFLALAEAVAPEEVKAERERLRRVR